MSDYLGPSDPHSPSDVAKHLPPESAPKTSSWALRGLFFLALLAALHLARDVALPILLALLLPCLFAPVVRGVQRINIAAPLSAAIIVLGLLSILVAGIYNLAGPARDWIGRSPRVLRQIGAELNLIAAPVKEVTSATEKVQEIAEKITGNE